MKVRGYLYERGSSERTEVTLEREKDRFHLTHGDDGPSLDVEIHTATDRLAGVPQTLILSTGQTFRPFEELPAGFLGAAEGATSRWIDWLERFTLTKAAVLAVVLVLGVLVLRAAVPLAADLVVAVVPHQYEAVIGRQTFREIDALMLSPSQLDSSRRNRLKTAALALARRGGIDPIPDIRFRRAPRIGANAFALPGGPIVVTDDLVRVLEDDDKIIAVLAHEFGHVEERHALRRVLRVAGIFLIASLILGGDQSILEEIAAVAVSTAGASYSRQFERDADAFAGRLLESVGRPATDLADALAVLLEACGEACRNDTGWLSTHPAVDERIQTLRANR